MSTTELSSLIYPDPVLEKSFKGHKDVVTALAFSPNLKQLASGSLDHAVLCYNFKAGMRSFKFIGHKGPVLSVEYHPSGHLLASASTDQMVKLWTPNVRGDVTTFKAHSATVRQVHFSWDGEQMLTASDDKSLKCWSTHRCKFLFTLLGHSNWVRSAQFSPDHKLAVSGGDDKTVKLWDLSSKSCLRTYQEHTGVVTSVAFHPSGHLVASCGSDRSIKLWDIRTHRLLQHYGDAHGSREGKNADTVNSVAFGGRSGEWLVSTGGDGLVKIWDLQQGHLFYTLHGHKVAPTTAALFSRDSMGGEFFATTGADAQVLLWRATFNATQNDSDANFGNKENLSVPNAAFSSTPLSNRATSQFKSTRNESRDGNVEVGASLSFPFTKQAKSDAERVHAAISRRNHQSDSHPSSAPNDHHSHHHPDDEFTRQRNVTFDEARTTQSPSHLAASNRTTTMSSETSSTVPIRPIDATLPEMASALTQIVHQLDILTQTMAIMEERLSHLEDAQEPLKHVPSVSRQKSE